MLYRMLDYIQTIGSSVNIIFKDTFKQMTIPRDRVISYITRWLVLLAKQSNLKEISAFPYPLVIHHTW